MLKGILGIVVASTLLSIAPASAAEMECTEANMMKANADVDKMAVDKKNMVMKEMTMAREKMDKKDMAGCQMHMNKAMEMGTGGMGMSK